MYKKIVLLTLSAFFSCLSNAQTSNSPKIVKKTRILFIFDCSGSMLAKWDGNELRIEAAKRILSELVDSLKKEPNLELALRVYGHQYDKKYGNCQDSKLEVAFSANNHNLIQQKIASLQPKGNTPIAYSLEQTAKDFPSYTNNNVKNIVLLITDGLESCKGDPCAVSLALQKNKIFLKPFIVGMGKLEDYGKELECVGKFVTASEPKTFKAVLSNAVKQSLQKTTIRINLLDHNNKATETHLNVTLSNNKTKEILYNFVHHYEKPEKGDPLEIDGFTTYDIKVNTVPNVIIEKVDIEQGKDNVINIRCPTGRMKILQRGISEYKNLQVIVKQENKTITLSNQKLMNVERYLAGKYALEILTLPRIYTTVDVKQGQTSEIEIPVPGILNIGKKMKGYGSIYKLDPDNGQEWIYNFPNDNSQLNIPMQPGNYRIVFLADGATHSEFTQVLDFNIKSGLTTNLNLY
jgi:Ca-activated chloride channel homolog